MTDTPTGDGSISTWWDDLRSAALVGTSRRDVPDPPRLGVVPPQGGRERRLWESAALADVVRRAGRPAANRPAAEPVEPALGDSHEAAPASAGQVLDLLLHQPPVSAAERIELVRHWMQAAVDSGRRVPHELLPGLLDLATAQPTLQQAVTPALGEVGVWLGRQNPAWRWTTAVAQPQSVDQEEEWSEWAKLPDEQRAALVARERGVDPERALALIASTWETDPAKQRASHVECLRVGLSVRDSDFLESCLDDRAKGVREAAARVLDGLPDSPRGQRMAARLRDLLTIRGTLRRTLVVALPDTSDETGTRDMLDRPAGQGSQRASWLQHVVQGAPLKTWTDVTGQSPERVIAMLDDTNRDVVVPALRETARLRGDRVWARALLAETWDLSLARQLPPEELEAAVLERLRRRPLPEALRDLTALPRPLGPAVSRGVVSAWRQSKERIGMARTVGSAVGGGLDPAVIPTLEQWLRGLGPDDDKTLRTTLRDLLQESSLRLSISEAFR